MDETKATSAPWERHGLSLDRSWPTWPSGPRPRDVAGVAVGDSRNVYVFTRADAEVFVFTVDGVLVRRFGRGLFTMPHSIVVDGAGFIYCTDCGDSTVRKFSPSGDLVLELGSAHRESDTGWTKAAQGEVRIHDVERVRYPGAPFNGCTDVAVTPDGVIFVTDGYRNCCVHRFSASGELEASWGAVGSGPGEFRLPHAIALDGERLLVADRENDRIQVFDLSGRLLGVWTGLQRPTDLAVHPDGRVFVTELWRPPGNRSFVSDTADQDEPSRMAVLSGDGEVLGRWSATAVGDMDGYFIAPHSLAIDPDGRVYVGEVTSTFAIERGLVDDSFLNHTLQRFVPYER